MKRLLIGLLGLVLLAIIGVVVAATLIPKDVYKAKIETAAADTLGREIKLNGDVGLGFFPRIAANVEDVTVANPEGFTADHMIRAGALRASVKWMPLFAGRVEVQEIAFVDADVSLERLADGRANWEFDAASETKTEDPASEAPPGEINAGIDRARLVNAALSYVDAVEGQAYSLTDLNIEASVKSLNETLTAEGTGVLDGDAFSFDLTLDSPQAVLDGAEANTVFELTTDLAEISYDGSALLGDVPTMTGAFSFRTASLQALANKAEIDPASLPVALAPLGGLSARGTVSGALDALQLDFAALDINGDGMQINYTGGATLAETPSVDGTLDLTLANAAATIAALGLDIPEAAALQDTRLTFKSALAGPSDAISAKGIDLALAGPLLAASYQGDIALANGGSLDGQLRASSEDLRTLMDAAAIEMAPGDTLQTFSVSGAASGGFDNFAIKGLDLTIDDLTGTGDLTVQTDRPRPLITGDLTTGPLDLTAFMGEPEETPEGWSKEPLALDSLNMLDADINLTSPSIKVDKITLSDARFRAQLVNGVLAATMDQFNVFGGTWRGNIGVNARANTPTLAMVLTGDSILFQDIMQAFAGTDMLSGGGQFKLDVTASGESVHAIMNSLNGDLAANLSDGALKGINIGQLVRSATDLRSSLASGSLNLGLSPSDETDFSSFDSILSIRNGVADIERLKLLSSTLGVDGLGSIDLGKQSLDMALRIAADKNARGELVDVQLNNVGIPLRITGDWLAPKIVPDTSALTSMLAGNVIDSLVGEGGLEDALGETAGNALGGVLGGVLGGNRDDTAVPPSAPASDTAADGATAAAGETPDPDEKAEPETVEEAVEDAVEDLARDALGDLFGKRGD